MYQRFTFFCKAQFFLFFLLFAYSATAQNDTVFVRDLGINNVRNISAFGDKLYYRVSDSLFAYHKGESKFVAKVSQIYSTVFYNQKNGVIGIRDHENLPTIPRKDINPSIYPGKPAQLISQASIDNFFYLSFNGRILEFETNNFFQHSFKGYSIRSIAIYGDHFIVGTYNGVFRADFGLSNIKKIEGTEYLNGYINEIDGTIYFNQDNLMVYDSINNSAKVIDLAIDGDRFRKIMNYKNQVYALKTETIKKVKLQGDNYEELDQIETVSKPSDMEFDEGLVYSTIEGDIVTETHSRKISKSRIIDFDIKEDKIYAASSNTLFVLNKKNLNTLNQFNINEEIYEIELIDENILVLTKNGLKIIRDLKIYNLINHFEFNNKAVLVNQGEIFLGTINGLIRVNMDYVNKTIIPNLEYKTLENEVDTYKFSTTSTVIILILVLTTGYYYLRNRGNNEKENTSNPQFTLKHIETIIKEGKVKNVNELAEYFGVSRVTINQKFKEFEFSPIDYIRKIKIELVHLLHSEKKLTAKQIGEEVGYSEIMVRKILKNGKSNLR
jgi:AraC-like DNA-binding protein